MTILDQSYDLTVYSYPGNPNTHITAKAVGDLCVDTVTPAIWEANGGAVWTQVGYGGGGGGSFPTFTGVGTPEGNQHANAGESYQDTSSGALYLFQGTNTQDTGWVCVAGAGDATITGVTSSDGNGVSITNTDDSGTVIDDSGAGGVQLVASAGPMTIQGTHYYVHVGNPNGAVTALAKGDICTDTTTPALWLAAGAGTVWTQVGAGGGGGSFPTYTGAGTPEGNQHANKGESYQDTSTFSGALYLFQGTNTQDTGWVCVAGAGDDTIDGVTSGGGNGLVITNTEASGTVIYDSAAGGIELVASAGPLKLQGVSFFVNAGDPNTTVPGNTAGDLCVDTTTPALWIYTGIALTWIKVGP